MSEEIKIRRATREDLPEIVRMFCEDDILGGNEEYSDPLLDGYIQGFEAIDRDENHLLIVAEIGEKIVGTLQITFIPGIIYKGGSRALIEAVMVDKNSRSYGIGNQMMRWAIEKAKEKKCRLVQLTSNKKRLEAHKFYGRLDFIATHEGFKLDLGKL